MHWCHVILCWIASADACDMESVAVIMNGNASTVVLLTLHGDVHVLKLNGKPAFLYYYQLCI